MLHSHKNAVLNPDYKIKFKKIVTKIKELVDSYAWLLKKVSSISVKEHGHDEVKKLIKQLDNLINALFKQLKLIDER